MDDQKKSLDDVRKEEIKNFFPDWNDEKDWGKLEKCQVDLRDLHQKQAGKEELGFSGLDQEFKPVREMSLEELDNLLSHGNNEQVKLAGIGKRGNYMSEFELLDATFEQIEANLMRLLTQVQKAKVEMRLLKKISVLKW